ncbi:MAG: DUF4363 family protein [Clostridia bacterium]|nr:DUF4363 family protein [Clostridia bacterium]
MKNYAVIISLSILAVLICIVFINCRFINGLCDDLEELRTTLPDKLTGENTESAMAAASKMKSHWDDKRLIASFSVAETELDALQIQIDTLICAISENDNTEYRKAVAVLWTAIDDIRRLELVSAENIF